MSVDAVFAENTFKIPKHIQKPVSLSFGPSYLIKQQHKLNTTELVAKVRMVGVNLKTTSEREVGRSNFRFPKEEPIQAHSRENTN